MSKKGLILIAFLIAAGVIALRTPSKRNREVIAVCDESAPLQVEEEVTLDDSLLPPVVDRLSQLFDPRAPRLPFIETITYNSRVPWLEGRLAFIGDYAAQYKTSKHFISRSLHGKGHYLLDRVANGDCFNVLNPSTDLQFHLVLDLTRCHLWVYAFDGDAKNHLLLKRYPVCCGRRTAYGYLTPTGLFALGGEIATYKPGAVQTVRNELIEMVTLFGTRWIPIGEEVRGCVASAKGLGIQGTPWMRTEEGLVENRACMGKHESEGCIRLLTEDMEELFALIVSRPTYLHAVNRFEEATLPGEPLPL